MKHAARGALHFAVIAALSSLLLGCPPDDSTTSSGGGGGMGPGSTTSGMGGAGGESTSTTDATTSTSMTVPFPETCVDVRNNALDETGTPPADGDYTLYIDGEETKPWSAFCMDMQSDAPREFLNVEEIDNYSELGDGDSLVTTSFRRYRIDPMRLEIDLLDDSFATTDTEGPPLTLPGRRSHLPAGWSQFVPHDDNAGPPAKGNLDLKGTAFVMSRDVLDDSYFCVVVLGAEQGDSSQSVIDVDNELASFKVTASNSVGDTDTRTIADCENLGGDTDFSEGVLPLQYSPR